MVFKPQKQNTKSVLTKYVEYCQYATEKKGADLGANLGSSIQSR